jgi:hypothetical protein
MLVTIVMTISVFILFMFFIMMFNVYFDYILSIASLSLCLCISSYSAHSNVHKVGGRYCVSVMLIRCLPANPVESFVVHSPNIGASRI